LLILAIRKQPIKDVALLIYPPNYSGRVI